MNIFYNALITLLFLFSLGLNAIAYAANTTSDLSTTNINWQTGPATFPKGAKQAVLVGDPNKTGPFTMQVMFPANYQVPAHSSPSGENISVMSGEVNIGVGNQLDKSGGKLFQTGSYVFIPANQNHYMWTGDKPAIIQINDVGPWVIVYVDKSNDPRNQKN